MKYILPFKSAQTWLLQIMLHISMSSCINNKSEGRLTTVVWTVLLWTWLEVHYILESPRQQKDLGLITGRGKSFFSSPKLQDRFWGSLASYSMGTGGSFPGGKVGREWSWPSPSSSAEVKNKWSCTLTFSCTFMAYERTVLFYFNCGTLSCKC